MAMMSINDDDIAFEKKSRAVSPARKIVSTLFPQKFDLILIDGVALLMRAGLLPRLGPPDLSHVAGLRLDW